ncbi:RusA family crossover junction endodeoxyribonuclease [Nocardioides alkalitolerans]|uniref:RusA family crossover junction endodeoxyribonuclease n=1 Tax=Nocardioides alkalitolerans TaxID=281714 RepID=UPI000427BAD7|nr:RusA family crossover junction endodeoxyribonuclease [Nocardioides alkalitolerans]
MLTRSLALTIWGAPATKGSMKCIGARGKAKHALVDDHATTKPYVDKVVAAVMRKWPADQRASEGQPIHLMVTLSLARPDYHFGTGRNAGVVKDRHVHAFPTGANTGDTDKYLRALMDAYQAGHALHNDAQVVDCFGSKRYVALGDREGDVLPRPGVVVRVTPLVVPSADVPLPDLEEVTTP